MISIRRLFFSVAGLALFTILPGQAVGSGQDGELQHIYETARARYGEYTLLRNGIYYEYPYFFSKGHPFLYDDKFHTGSVVYRNEEYKQVQIRYDIFHQQIILNLVKGNEMVQILPEVLFVPEFTIGTAEFRRLVFQDNESLYCQIIAEEQDICCAYYWYKGRTETGENGSFKTYIFGEEKNRKYLFINGKEYRYTNNRNFLAAFPESARPEIREYLASNRIKVRLAGDDVMKSLLAFCQQTLNKN